jgi:predicted amidohydrolase
MLLVAPDSRLWRYDKHYPWVWERVYFRAGRSITVAETDLGRLGLMICWDAAHPEWWARYAGKVDAMVIASCPPAVHDMTFVFPDGQRVRSGEAGPVTRNIKQTSSEIFGVRLRCQATHLGVPVVNTTGAGRFSTTIPMPRFSFALLTMMKPLLWRHLAHAKDIRVEAGYFNETYVADASGRVLAHVPLEQEGYIIAQVALVDSLPRPKGKQPPFGIHPAAYLFDVMANVILAPVYRQRMRHQISSIKSQI